MADQRTREQAAEDIIASIHRRAVELGPLYGLPPIEDWEGQPRIVRLLNVQAVQEALPTLVDFHANPQQYLTVSDHRHAVEQAAESGYVQGWNAATDNLGRILDDGDDDGAGRMLAATLVDRVLYAYQRGPRYSGLTILLRAWTDLDVQSATMGDGELTVQLRGDQTAAADFLAHFRGHSILDGRYHADPDDANLWHIVIRADPQPSEASIEVPIDDESDEEPVVS